MELINEVLEFKIMSGTDTAEKITKQEWIKSRDHLQVQIDKISTAIWDGGNQEEIAGAMSSAIYTITALACHTGVEDKVKQYLQEEYKNPSNIL